MPSTPHLPTKKNNAENHEILKTFDNIFQKRLLAKAFFGGFCHKGKL
jgi:hypothetical protein